MTILSGLVDGVTCCRAASKSAEVIGRSSCLACNIQRLLTGRQEVNTQCRPLVGWRFGHVSQAQNTPQLYNLSLAISQGRIHNIARDPGRCRMYLRMLACNYSRCTHLLISSCCHIFVLGKQPIYRSAAACVWLSLLLLLHMLHMLHHVPS